MQRQVLEGCSISKRSIGASTEAFGKHPHVPRARARAVLIGNPGIISTISIWQSLLAVSMRPVTRRLEEFQISLREGGIGVPGAVRTSNLDIISTSSSYDGVEYWVMGFSAFFTPFFGLSLWS